LILKKEEASSCTFHRRSLSKEELEPNQEGATLEAEKGRYAEKYGTKEMKEIQKDEEMQEGVNGTRSA